MAPIQSCAVSILGRSTYPRCRVNATGVAKVQQVFSRIGAACLLLLIGWQTTAETLVAPLAAPPAYSCDSNGPDPLPSLQQMLDGLCDAVAAEAAAWPATLEISLIVEDLRPSHFRGRLEWQVQDVRQSGPSMDFGTLDRDLGPQDIPAIVTGLFAASNIPNAATNDL